MPTYCICLVCAIASPVDMVTNGANVARLSQEAWTSIKHECLDSDKSVCREDVLTCVVREVETLCYGP